MTILPFVRRTARDWWKVYHELESEALADPMLRLDDDHNRRRRNAHNEALKGSNYD